MGKVVGFAWYKIDIKLQFMGDIQYRGCSVEVRPRELSRTRHIPIYSES